MFKPVDTAIKFAENEARILAFWKEHGIFEKSLRAREDVKDTRHWVFYEGPPTANGKPHPGHVLTRVVKDLFPRYKTMCGYYVPRKAGWDTHGLPVEIEVEKELKLDGKTEVLKYGVEPFVRKCMDSVFKYTTDWEQLTEKIGFWIDLKDAYVTYHKEYVESVWWSLKELFQQNLLYRGHKILPWCPHCQTGLSAAEVGLGYETVEDPSCFVTFRDVNWDQNKTSFVAWTTTPWTLPSNAGLAVKTDTEYSYVKVGEETLIMASALVKQVMGKIPYEVVKTEMGSALVGKRYAPLFDFWRPPVPPASGRAGGRGYKCLARLRRRFRHPRHRLRHRPHGPRLRRRRLRPRPKGRPARHPARRRRRQIRRRLRRVHRPLLQRGRPRYSQRPEAARPAAQARELQARIPVLLALQKPADLFRPRRLVHPHHARDRPRHRKQPEGGLAPRASDGKSTRRS